MKFSARIFVTLISLSALMGATQLARAETQFENIIGTVNNVVTLTNSYVRKTPRDERVCTIQDVPVYGQSQQSDELGSMIIGGLLGAAAGNKLSNNDGAGAAGAVAGAILGRQHAKASTRPGGIVGYRQQEVCRTNRVYQEEQITNITGYRVEVEADGQIITLTSSSSFNVGDRIEIGKQISYSLR